MASVWKIKESGPTGESGVTGLRVATGYDRATTHLPDTTGPGVTDYRMDTGSKPTATVVRYPVINKMA